MKKYSTEQLRDQVSALEYSFARIKEDSMDLNHLMSHVGLLSMLVSDILKDEIAEREGEQDATN
jgi:hypothetical protein